MTNINVTVFPAEPGYQFIFENSDGQADLGVPVLAWRIVTKASADGEQLLSETEGLDALGETGRAKYLGIANPKGQLKFFDGREYLSWDELIAHEDCQQPAVR